MYTHRCMDILYAKWIFCFFSGRTLSSYKKLSEVSQRGLSQKGLPQTKLEFRSWVEQPRTWPARPFLASTAVPGHRFTALSLQRFEIPHFGPKLSGYPQEDRG